jgi:hypothetical protein
MIAIKALLSKNLIALAAILALCAWARFEVKSAIKTHDTQVARAAVETVQEQSRAKVQKAKQASRRVDPARADGVLDGKYCADC